MPIPISPASVDIAYAEEWLIRCNYPVCGFPLTFLMQQSGHRKSIPFASTALLTLKRHFSKGCGKKRIMVKRTVPITFARSIIKPCSKRCLLCQIIILRYCLPDTIDIFSRITSRKRFSSRCGVLGKISIVIPSTLIVLSTWLSLCQ